MHDTMQGRSSPAPEWEVARWLNTKTPLSLADVRGRVVVVLAFQILCPGCAQHALPQVQRVQAAFAPERVAVVGLHTVFEHHAAMGEATLRAFAHEYRLTFPIGIDEPGEAGGDGMPRTMRRYAMRGTPTLLLYDRRGGLRRQHFGHVEDIQLGADIAFLLAEPSAA